MQYSFHLCPTEDSLVFLEAREFTLVDAMGHAIELAFKEGAKSGPTRGHFVCVHDDQGHEVFRTPFGMY